jgi:nucleoside-diphosphate-sugar epimerase
VESDPPAPVSEYGRSKLAGEIAAQAHAERVPLTIVRAPITLGEGDAKGLTLFWAISRFACHLVPGWGNHRYSVIHVADLLRGIILAAERGARVAPPGSEAAAQFRGFYYLAGDEHPTYAELGRLAKDAVGRRHALILPVAMPLVKLICSCGEAFGRLRGRACYLNFDKYREIAAGPWACSPQRAKKELGFAVETPLAERLRQTVQWYRREGWL